MMQLTNLKKKHEELGNWTTSGSHTILLPDEVFSCAYLLANPVLRFGVEIISVTKIHYPKGRYIY